MEVVEIIQEISNHPAAERLEIVKGVLASLRNRKWDSEVVRKAAELAVDDYQNDMELTAFSSLDTEPFKEYE